MTDEKEEAGAGPVIDIASLNEVQGVVYKVVGDEIAMFKDTTGIQRAFTLDKLRDYVGATASSHGLFAGAKISAQVNVLNDRVEEVIVLPRTIV